MLIKKIMVLIMKAQCIIDELVSLKNPGKAHILQRFFKTDKGQYGEGDVFLGITVPQIRALVKKYKMIDVSEIQTLLLSQYHECRMAGLFFLINVFNEKKNENETKKIYDFYIKNVDYINNWDLVDLSAPNIIGHYLFEKERSDLHVFAKTNHLWLQRISIVSTYYFIRHDDLHTTFEISSILQNHPHDLIHKAVGWMLREAGKKNFEAEYQYLTINKRYQNMPRTMLRYAIEKFPEELRQNFLKNNI